MNKIMISCEEAAFLINKSEYSNIGFKNRMLLSLHLMACQDCKNYYKQSKLITAITSALKTEDFSGAGSSLCDAKKEEMQKAVEKELGKKD